LLPLKIETTGMLVMKKQWDRKEIQWPGARVRVTVGKPVFVRDEREFESAKRAVANQL
jgi:lysophospholipid acyltransferase (LPLAT)-like uncharacterized protein